MRLLALGLRNSHRNLRRTLFTGLSLAVSLFLFCALTAVVRGLENNVERAGQNPVGVVIHRAGFTHMLPESYAARVAKIPGIKSVLGTLYYGGHYGNNDGPQDRFPSIAIDTQINLRDFWGEDFKVDDAAWAAYFKNRTAALVGPQVMRKFGWKRGQKITLHGTLWPVDLEFTIAGEAWFRTDQSTFLLHREYLDEAIGHPGLLTMVWFQAPDVASLPTVAAAVNAEFAHSSDPVRTLSQKQLITTFLGMLGDISGLVSGIALLVVIAVLFVTANSIALSARERTTEVAVLKALGFSGRDILASMLVEAATLTTLGGGIGCLGAYLVFRKQAFSLGFGPLSGFQVSLGVAGIGLATAAVMGIAASLLPALRTIRTPTVAGLRRAA